MSHACPPRTGRELWGWLQSQPEEVRARARSIASSRGFRRFVDMDPDEAVSLWHDLTVKVRDAFGMPHEAR